MKARKRFGQHFLHDPAVLDRIAHAVAPGANDALVEIGPGRGALTRVLLESDARTLDAIEIDRDLAPRLREQFASDARFHVHEADALEFDFTALARERGASRLRIVGNLPYNISTPLLFHLLKHVSVIDDMHVMLQREVVNRIAARPGYGDYGRLTVMLAPWLEAEALFEVGPGAFQPPPKVWSAVARLSVRREPAFAVSPRFAAVVASAFSHRRKTLRNALKGLATAAQIESCDVDPNARPETLAPEAFNRLAQSLG
ncbi:MAG TPA: 16S rRNA (adenine(1518)-N(6)/adenine(1519)-N(6))-dimethyltransferase RsmA [Steroidobacteraceae bacterium]|jgi:16S rRNA (adenine1518-N6/adenine1519-N6)-dimethyltransferase|nr:16S rRNA (adenine(1518)-N(6)/adenine(1519)-N(6))-dimethyltransferase RsmA [Steroidobacteraceae bacterium]